MLLEILLTLLIYSAIIIFLLNNNFLFTKGSWLMKLNSNVFQIIYIPVVIIKQYLYGKEVIHNTFQLYFDYNDCYDKQFTRNLIKNRFPEYDLLVNMLGEKLYFRNIEVSGSDIGLEYYMKRIIPEHYVNVMHINWHLYIVHALFLYQCLKLCVGNDVYQVTILISMAPENVKDDAPIRFVKSITVDPKSGEKSNRKRINEFISLTFINLKLLYRGHTRVQYFQLSFVEIMVCIFFD